MTSKLKIQELDPIEHILKRPDMYVGSNRMKKCEEFVGYVQSVPEIAREEDGNESSASNQSEEKKEKLSLSIKKETILFSPAILRIFVEALSNAIDNAKRSKDANVPCSKIKIVINKETGETSVWNDGLVIPIEEQKSSSSSSSSSAEYKHTMIFGKLRTSTNFNDDEERTVSGRNGLGIKLTNVFSKSFQVNSVDPESGKLFSQQWDNNMRQVSAPKITKSSLKTGYTEVKWIPDFSQFHIDGYTDEIIRLYTRYVFDAAMLTGLNVYLNDVKLPIRSLLDYSKLFASPTSETIAMKSKDSEVVITTNMTNEFEAVSFVNGVFTMHGGKHVDAWSEAVFRPIVDHFNKPKKPQISIKDVKQFYRIFVVSTLVNPEFSSQSKTELTAPEVYASADKKHINAILKWETTSKVNDIISSKEILVMKKSESKKRGFTAIEGYMPANEAGGKNSSQCMLALCEGLSAKSFVVKGMDSPYAQGKGRDYIGVYPLRGKILNVRDSNGKQIAENKEITAIIQALNLRYDVDYTKDENFATLNYGKLLILTDADTDGKHITGLIINFFHHLFPTLLSRPQPFLVNMLTPIAKFFSKKEEKIFYDLHSADEYFLQAKSENIHIRVRYYKGLGSHTDKEIAEEFGKRILSYVKTEDCDAAIVKAFDKKYSDYRKKWLEDFDPKFHTVIDELTLERTISVFVNEDLITYSADHCVRAIPHIMDGLKQSQRKILYAAFLKNLKSICKVAQFAGYVAEKTNYHHGEQNLNDTIIKMAQAFVGRNNIPIFFREGQFGSRLQNGKDAANARYIFTRLESITRAIFREEDDVLLNRVVDDGDLVEPEYYVPIVPMILINGCDGIGTGWASSIPLFNPLDVIHCVKEWIADPPQKTESGLLFSSIPEIVPWYRGFTGRIIADEKDSTKFISSGILARPTKEDEKKKSKNKVTITEIPVDMSIQSCYDMLTHLTHEEKKLKGFKDYSGADSPLFEIDEYTDGMLCSISNLKLTSSISTSNMVLFDKNMRIKKYQSVHDIICEFCDVRLAFYQKRKKFRLEDLMYLIIIAKNKERFITEVMNSTLQIHRKKEEEIYQLLEARQYTKEPSRPSTLNDLSDNDARSDGSAVLANANEKAYSYLLRLTIRSFTQEKIEELQKEISRLEAEHKKLLETKETDIWIQELDHLESVYKVWLRDITAEQERKVKKSKPSKV
jgi:DNA topoisomerase-2